MLLFVLDRTIGWRKVWECISTKEFENGVVRKASGNVSRVVHGTGLPPEQTMLAIEALEQIGAIDVSKQASKTFYRIKEEWCHPSLQQNASHRIWDLNESDFVDGSRDHYA